MVVQKKKTLYITAGVITLAVVAVILVFLLDLQALKPRIEAAASNALGMDVRVSGRTLVYAALNHQPFYAQPSQQFLDSGQKEPGEPHSAYHEYLFKLRKIKDILFTQSARALAVERDAYLREYFLQLAGELAGER